jgi:WD40 repeat protein
MINEYLIKNVLDYIPINCLDYLDESTNKTIYQYKLNRDYKEFSTNCILDLNNETQICVTDIDKRIYNAPDKFCVYKSVDNQHYIVWSNAGFGLVVYDLVEAKMVNVLTGHNKNVLSIRHFTDNLNDYLITSSKDLSIFIWKDLTYFKKVVCPHGFDSYLTSSILLFENDGELLLVSLGTLSKSLKVIELKETPKVIKGITENEKIFYLDSVKDSGITYLVVSGIGMVKSYYLSDCNNYRHYMLGTETSTCESFVIEKLFGGEILSLVTSFDKNIYIWDFHRGELLKTLTSINNSMIYNSLALWNESLIVTGCKGDKLSINKISDSQYIEVVKTFKPEYGSLSCVKRYNHPLYGPSLFIYGNDGIIFMMHL